MNRRVFAALVFILLVAAQTVSSLGAGAPSYQIEDLGTTSDGYVPTVTGMNASGQLSGYVSRPDGQRAVRYTNGTGWAYLPGLLNFHSAATAINVHGDLTGYFNVGGLRPFRYVDGPGLTGIPLLAGGTFGRGMAIADNGDVVGHGNSSAGTRGWRTSVGLNPVVPSGLAGTNSMACGVNNTGQMVGTFTTGGFQHAFRVEANGTLTDIGTLEGPSSLSTGCALDANGMVGGLALVGDAAHAFVSSGGTPIDVDTFGSGFSSVLAISNGVAVGWYTFSAVTGESHAFVYAAADGTTDLNTRIPAGSGWVLSEATAVNSNGQIAGHGLVAGVRRVFRLTPSAAAADTTAPVITSVTATPSSITPPNSAMVPVAVSVSATDDVDEAPACALSTITGGAAGDFSITGPFAAAVKAVGNRTYSLRVSCSDAAGNASMRSVDVVVPPDTTPPVVTSLTVTPAVVWPPNDALVAVTVAVSATDDSAEAPACALSAITSSGTSSAADDYAVTGQYSGKVRAVGGQTYSLRVTCADAAGNRRDASVNVVVPPDTTAPVITALAATPDHIWPPNGKMESVTLLVAATDDVDAAPKCALTSITGAPASSAVITGAFSANLRADKDVVYTLNVTCGDRAGNKALGSVKVAVSKDSPSAAKSSKK